MTTEVVEVPANPFTELPRMGTRRTLGYESELVLPRSDRRLVPMQLFEGMDLFPPVAQLLERCRYFEERCAALEAERNGLMGELERLESQGEKRVRKG